MYDKYDGLFDLQYRRTIKFKEGKVASAAPIKTSLAKLWDVAEPAATSVSETDLKQLDGRKPVQAEPGRKKGFRFKERHKSELDPPRRRRWKDKSLNAPISSGEIWRGHS